jgi:DNA-binding CsgD family transcriptional regulator
VAIRRGSYLCPVPSLSTRDYDAALGVVAAASHGSSVEPLPTPVLESIRRLFAADTVGYFEGPPWDRARRRLWIAGDHEPWTRAQQRLNDDLRFQNPLLPTPATVGRAWRMTDRMTLRAYRRTDLYNLLGRPHRIEYSMDYWMRAPDGIVRGLSIDASTRDFSERDRDLLDVLGRHLATVLGKRDPRLPRPAAELGLTRREAEILALVARGRTNEEIAAVLSVSAHTVRKHLENAFLRLGVHSRAAAIAVAYESSLQEAARSHG